MAITINPIIANAIATTPKSSGDKRRARTGIVINFNPSEAREPKPPHATPFATCFLSTMGKPTTHKHLPIDHYHLYLTAQENEQALHIEVYLLSSIQWELAWIFWPDSHIDYARAY